MADKLVRNRDDNSVIERYVDMGDGTWARKTSGGSGSSAPVADIIIYGATFSGIMAACSANKRRHGDHHRTAL